MAHHITSILGEMSSSSSSTSLYGSRSLASWDAALAGYLPAIASFSAGVPRRAQLPADAAWLLALPATVRARSPPALTQPELSRLMRFKLARGKSRPNLQKFVDAALPKVVEAASTAAAAHLAAGKLAQALEAISAPLKGVGPATGSLILSILDASVPFMEDQALTLVCGTRGYTDAEFLQLTAALRKEASALNALAGSGGTWTAATVEQAMWSAAHGGGEGATAAQGSGAGAGTGGGQKEASKGGKKEQASKGGEQASKEPKAKRARKQ